MGKALAAGRAKCTISSRVAGATMRRRGRGARRRQVPRAKETSSLFARGGTPATLDSVPDTNHQSLRARAEIQATA